ncbi:hypothetical protein JXB27_02740 [Candidatus Woesearchaeota archaeon]|nr:hypothetical protein [Candidatus Woesearchaeota archaeon]
MTEGKKAVKKRKSFLGRLVSWIIIILVFYALTSATASTGPVEIEKKVFEKYTVQEKTVVEKMVKSTKYREEKTPYGTPRCEQMNYNFTFERTISEKMEGGKKIATCSFAVTNQEDMDGKFIFYVQFTKGGSVSDGPDQTKTIPAFGTEVFSWDTELELTDSISCLLYSNNLPKRMKCFYLEPITYQIKQVPYTVEELKNVTEFVPIEKTRESVIKENVTANIYTNNFFGYRQFFYLGY